MKPVRVHLIDITLNARIGVYEWEHNRDQKIVVNVWLEYDATDARKHDSIHHALHYGDLLHELRGHIQSTQVELLETLCDQLLTIILMHPRALWAKVQIEKPEVFEEYHASVTVTDERNRKDAP